jgi:hypothetical protein
MPVKPNVTVPVKPGPGFTVMGTVVPVPRGSVREAAGAVTVKFGVAEVTVKVRLALLTVQPDVPDIVTL